MEEAEDLRTGQGRQESSEKGNRKKEKTMKTFMECDTESAQSGYQQIIDELKQSNPDFLASLTDDDIFIKGYLQCR